MNAQKILLSLLLLPGLYFLTSCRNNVENMPEKAGILNYVEISKDNPAYFQLSDGTPYVPIGINMINPNSPVNHPDSAMMEVESWMKKLAENGGNYVRIWLSQSFWDMEHEKAGEYDPEKIKRIDWFIKTARKYGLRIKMTFEHFRSVTLEENPQGWATKSVYHTSEGGPLQNIGEYITTEAGHKLFLDKLDFYQERYGSDTVFFGWELWNEMNAMRGPEDSAFFAWNEMMLDETKKRFPENLVMQSLGSFDREDVRDTYRRMMELPGNEVAQIHRYLDLGANMEICHAPMDIITSSAIDELLSYNPGKPSILAETGGVEPRHTGPIRYYKVDTAGILLHDVLFAPFFSGSAGAGMNWHWNAYVDPNDLWYHFGRFASAVKGINPISEQFLPVKIETDIFRIYMLKGKVSTLIWIRDKNNTWRSELEAGLPPQTIRGAFIGLDELKIDAMPGTIRIYDPWKDRWSETELEENRILFPDFKRSLVLKMQQE
ncbi:MAG: hypothetical protein KFF73_13530 [Cyclobacteriaceae bacterium]|nr:hypothetical protein [Cyclobacteriaceae bacterium]